MVKAVLCGSSFVGTICGRENLSTRRGDNGATIRPLCDPPVNKKKKTSLYSKQVGGEIPRPPNHKRHLFRRDIFRSDDQVPLVLAVCRIEYNDEFPSTCPPPNLTPQLAAGSLLSKTRNRCETFKKSYTPLPPNRRAGRGKGVREGYGKKERKKEKKKAHGTPRQPPVSS